MGDLIWLRFSVGIEIDLTKISNNWESKRLLEYTWHVLYNFTDSGYLPAATRFDTKAASTKTPQFEAIMGNPVPVHRFCPRIRRVQNTIGTRRAAVDVAHLVQSLYTSICHTGQHCWYQPLLAHGTYYKRELDYLLMVHIIKGSWCCRRRCCCCCCFAADAINRCTSKYMLYALRQTGARCAVCAWGVLCDVRVLPQSPVESGSKLTRFLCRGIEIDLILLLEGIEIDSISVMGSRLTWFLCAGSKLTRF